ncbi:MAG: hypothetical protein R2781_11250 [Flavobacteriaceae bacterium]
MLKNFKKQLEDVSVNNFSVTYKFNFPFTNETLISLENEKENLRREFNLSKFEYYVDDLKKIVIEITIEKNENNLIDYHFL